MEYSFTCKLDLKKISISPYCVVGGDDNGDLFISYIIQLHINNITYLHLMMR